MRPLRLELEGFSAFRDRVSLDFEDTDLFAFTGATGAGKSSLIDAMTFALYGNVPRYDDRRLVHAAIHQGSNEAKVRFDFAVGPRRYTAVRVVRRTRKRNGETRGATTKEARLESEGRVLAGSAEELTSQVEGLLGLGFEQFTTCVVLPQGEFARFLHGKPTERQKLLGNLLGLDVYRRVRSNAHARESEARRQAEFFGQRLEELPAETTVTLRECEKGLTELERLQERVEEALPELTRIAGEREEKRREVASVTTGVEKLRSIRVPPRVGALAQELQAAQHAFDGTTREVERTVQDLESARQAREGLGSIDELEAVVRAYVERDSEGSRRDDAAAHVEKTTQALDRANELLEGARKQREQAEAEREEVRRAHAAHALAAHLVEGKPCPVCSQPVQRKPRGSRPASLKRVEEAARTARREEEAASKLAAEAERCNAAAQGALADLELRLGEIERRLSGALSREEVLERLERIAAADRTVRQAEERVHGARLAEKNARVELEAGKRGADSAWQAYEAARDGVAHHAPPAARRDDLAASWEHLVAWAAETAQQQTRVATALERAAEEAEAQRRVMLGELAEAGAALGVAVREDAPRDGIVEAVLRTRSRADEIRKTLEQGSRLRARVKQARRETEVAATLARHLKADGFERWLLDDALDQLVTAGSDVLRDLSSGQYSFTHNDQGNFEVVDHHNADERRLIKTLSGGETFLASLALSLTLVDQVAEMAVEGPAPLESVFLDEGFGSLDPDTLETVAVTIEELGTRGRTVCLVTHVKELAERIPVQFRVTKGPDSSSVERVAC